MYNLSSLCCVVFLHGYFSYLCFTTGARVFFVHYRTWLDLRHNTIRDAILTCARKPTWVSLGLIYRTEPTTKKCKTEKKLQTNMLRSNSKSLGIHVVSPEEETERLQWEGFAEKEGTKEWVLTWLNVFFPQMEWSRAIRYDTIRDAILTCARKPTWVSLIYRTEPTTKKV